MRYISLPALKVALADLFANRLPALLASNAGKTYEPILQAKMATIEALPEALTSGKPLADVLTDVDDKHDDFGAAMHYLVEAYLRWPEIPADVRAALERIRAAFIPRLEALRAPYVEEVDAAMKHKSNIVTLEADLKSIPIAGGLSLYDWCMGFVTAGEQIGTLLSQRADIDTNGRREAGKIRSTTIGVLGRLRGALADEMAVNDALPRDLDARVFSLFDQLGAMRADALAARDRKNPASPPVENAP